MFHKQREDFMKKRLISLMMASVMMLGSLAACSQDNGGGSDAGDDTFELALITDVGTIDDKSFNQGSWEGLEQYAKENNLTHKYYQPAEKTTDAYLASIDLAVAGGAKVVVTPGYLFEPAVFVAQTTYPDVQFILIDGSPNNGDYEGDFQAEVAGNTYAVFYAEEQAGFLAGYAAVKEGYTKLGFMGGMAVPAVVKFGYGFVQGAEYAAEELGIDAIDVKYNYTGGFAATPEVQSRAASWFESGTEVIFACGGAVGNSVMAAAEAADGKVIGVDVDQSGESDTVITSSLKMLQKSVYDAIAAYYDGSFPGGQTANLGADVEGVGLPMETSKFENFTQEDYDAVYALLAAGQIDLVANVDANGDEVAVSALPVSVVQVEEIA